MQTTVQRANLFIQRSNLTDQVIVSSFRLFNLTRSWLIIDGRLGPSGLSLRLRFCRWGYLGLIPNRIRLFRRL